MLKLAILICIGISVKLTPIMWVICGIVFLIDGPIFEFCLSVLLKTFYERRIKGGSDKTK